MAIRSVFFDWSQPALRVAGGYLWEKYGRPGLFDLEPVIVALPGARSGRRLLEILVELGAEHGAALVPPQIVTVGQLPELLYEVKRPLADELSQQLAWVDALRATRRADVQRLVKRLPEQHDLAGWLGLGQMFAQLHRELAADALDFDHVLKRGAQLEGFLERERWLTLSALQKRYLKTLDKLNVWDRQTARLFAIEHRLCRTQSDVVLLATVDIDRAQRAMLDQVADRVTALVFAPQELADRFDKHGCLIAPAWRQMPVGIAREQIDVVDGPAEQADAVVRAMAGWDGAWSADEIAVGVPDERVLPYLEERLAEAGIATRFGAGVPLARSAPALLLAAVAEYLEAPLYRGLSSLVRHPDVDGWLRGRGIHEDYLTALDEYYERHLPAALVERWLGEPDDVQSVERVGRAVAELTAPLTGPRQPLADWADPIQALLLAVYGDCELDGEAELDRPILALALAVSDCLTEFRQLDSTLAPRVNGGEALRLVLARTAAVRVSPRPQAGAVALLGWLELPLDDSLAIVVTGMNEGIVPASQNADLFLPDRLRTALALVDNDRRYARDNYALNVLAASRRALRLIVGRRSTTGEPLVPSRLLLATDELEMAHRAKLFFAPAKSTGRVVLAGSPRSGRATTDLPIPMPRPLGGPVTSLRVTELRDYLACPYRYYLRHRLRLHTVSDAADEMEANQFGSLLHEVLKRFGASPLADSASADALRRGLDALVDEVATEELGDQTLAVARLQIEQLRLRLAAFANWQAGWRGEGWRIHATESDVGDRQCPLDVDGQPTYLRGRIDRIDVHEERGETIVFDYKSSDKALVPDKAHRNGEEWIDLQLPLYRHLARSLGIAGPIELGYICLPRDVKKTGAARAAWTDAELLSADEAAFAVIRRIRAQEFWPPATEPPPFCDDLAAICQDDVFGAMRLGATDEGEEDEP